MLDAIAVIDVILRALLGAGLFVLAVQLGRRIERRAIVQPPPLLLRLASAELDIEQPDVVCAQCEASYPPVLSECPRCKIKCASCRAALYGPERFVDLQPGQIYLRKPCPECGEYRYQIEFPPPGIS